MNRHRLRDFAGFEYTDVDDAYVKKAEYIEKNLNITDLVSICNILGLSYKKDDLTKHIFKNLQKGKLLACDDDDNDDNDGDDDVDDDDDGEVDSLKDDYESNQQQSVCKVAAVKDFGGFDINNVVRRGDRREIYNTMCVEGVSTNHMTKFALSFRDIEDSLRPFDGSNTFPIRAWLNEFEETAAVLYWDEFQKFVFAKKSLKGLAKLFIASEKGITNYKKLREILIEEFYSATNSVK